MIDPNDSVVASTDAPTSIFPIRALRNAEAVVARLTTLRVPRFRILPPLYSLVGTNPQPTGKLLLAGEGAQVGTAFSNHRLRHHDMKASSQLLTLEYG